MSDCDRAVLLVDDEGQFLQSASFVLRTSGYKNVKTCQDSRQVLDILSQNNVKVILLDIMMPHISGEELLPEIKSRYPNIPVIMVTAVNEIESAVNFMRNGAFDYIVKPIDKARLVTTVKKAVEHSEIVLENARLKKMFLSDTNENSSAFDKIITKDKSMLSIFKYIEAIAPTNLPVMITGETGCGKELIARAIHNCSGRTGDFVAVNVAGLDDTLFSDALFGHEKGAFTGAEKNRAGFLSKADGGTLFLDEIGELKVESQVKLLRLLEDRSFYAVGSDKLSYSDARVVVATNASVDPFSENSTFRKDLYYRLQSHHIALPPLRERKEDIPVLLEYFVTSAAKELEKKSPSFPKELYTLLGTHCFPGNVRELRGMVYDAVSRHQGGVLSMATFQEHINRSGGHKQFKEIYSSLPQGANEKMLFPEQLPTIKEIELLLVEEALRRADNNQSIASKMLGITRSALNKRINNPRN
ncbi:Sigma-54 dependent DNA-binding response regulator [Chitinispirillum alkaliphilum]|nr:Sigma-54 dependent DNA-binding response regulator [Chitinispirillum alkaliphilum]